MRKGSQHSQEARAKISRAFLGKRLPRETRTKMRLARLGEKNPRWNGGRRLNYGRLQIYVGPKQAYKLESRLIMEQHLGRKLRAEEVIHHIDRNPSNNKIENLQLFASQGEHMKLHRAQQKNKAEGIKWEFGEEIKT